jgi:hypothetical protein
VLHLVEAKSTILNKRKLKHFAREFSTGCFGHVIISLAAAALLGFGARHFGLPRLAVFALAVIAVLVVSVLLPRPKQMSEAYTQSTKRVIFLAREEAMRRGSSCIESEHLLLGVLRENATVATRLGGTKEGLSEFRRRVESITTVGQPIAGPVEVPLSADSKQVLLFTAEEADSLGHKRICIAHLLLGMLRVEKSNAASILLSGGATISGLRENATKDMRWADAPD